MNSYYNCIVHKYSTTLINRINTFYTSLVHMRLRPGSDPGIQVNRQNKSNTHTFFTNAFFLFITLFQLYYTTRLF